MGIIKIEMREIIKYIININNRLNILKKNWSEQFEKTE